MIDDDVAHTVAGALERRTIATAESCTAGRIVTVLAAVEGASRFVRGGVVAYQEEVKRAMLGVTADSIYSGAAVIEMAGAACRLLDVDVAVATSGVVGGEAVDGVEPGTVFVGTVVDGDARSSMHRFDGRPEQVCDAASRRVLLDVLEHIRAVNAAIDA